jgi:hypothetical protein
VRDYLACDYNAVVYGQLFYDDIVFHVTGHREDDQDVENDEHVDHSVEYATPTKKEIVHATEILNRSM